MSSPRASGVARPLGVAFRIAFSASILLTTVTPSRVAARTWLIRPGGDGDVATIQAGIDTSAAGDTILLAPGTYSGPGNTNVDFKGRAVVVKSQAGCEMTTIDCDSTARGFVFVSGESHDSVLEGVTIANGIDTFFGGAIMCRSASPTIKGNAFLSNSTGFEGGAVYCDSSLASIVGNHFENNQAQFGGALWISGRSSVDVHGNEFAGNAAAQGGAISCNSSDPQIEGNRFVGNVATEWGAAIDVAAQSAPTIGTNRFEMGLAFRGGGAIRCEGTAPPIRENIFAANQAGEKGGAIFCRNVATPLIENNTFDTNGAASGMNIFCETFSDATIGRNIIVTEGGQAIAVADLSYPWIGCNDFFGSAVHLPPEFDDGGGNIFTDPLFCGEPASGNFYLRSDSPCAPAQSPCGVLIGALDVGCTVVTAIPDADAFRLALYQNHPNPFNPTTTIGFDMPAGGGVARLSVFDARGRLVATLVDGYRAEGHHSIHWDGTNTRGHTVTSGVYFYRLSAIGVVETRKMVLAR